MKRIIKIDSSLIAPNSFRGRLKDGLVRCKAEAASYHACVTANYLDTQ